VKTWILALATFSLVGYAQEELQSSYAKLKESVDKKDVDAVKSGAAETMKLAQALINVPKPADAEEAKGWQERVDYGKEVAGYAEYSLGFTAAQGLEPAKVFELVDQLLAANPKSKYLDLCTSAYYAALGKSGGAKKQLEGMAKIAAGRPDNVYALQALAEGYASSNGGQALTSANRLVAAVKGNKRPEGLQEADWEKAKNTFLATGYYIAGAINCGKSAWLDCDRDLKAAVPLLQGDLNRLGPTYFYLGLANFQFGKMTQDRTKMQAGQKYSEQSAAIAGPMQRNAMQNAAAMKTELSTPGRR
jgi:hypothetical protein